MLPRIYNSNGTCIEFNGKKIGLDTTRKSKFDINFISHAHLDHAPATDSVTPKICSPGTKRLIKHRKGHEMINAITYGDFDFAGAVFKQLDSGHITESTSLLVEIKNQRIWYTGDICNKYRFHMKKAEVPKADVVIIESTYGNPSYVFPPIHETVERAVEWVKEQLESSSVILMGYPLGKAQILTKMIDGIDCVKMLHTSIHEMNNICKDFGFPYDGRSKYKIVKNKTREKKFLAIFPSMKVNSEIIKNIIGKSDVKTAAFTGWGMNPNIKYQMGFDAVFPLTDHCDFNGLMQIVKEADAQKVFTFHGFDQELAKEIKERLGIDAQPLTEEKGVKKFIF